MEPLLKRIRRGEVLVSDGAMGTMLLGMGLAHGDCPERWNLERPEVLEHIARSYLEAGADIIQTNTFGASPIKLAHYSLDDRTDEVNRAAVRAARRAIGEQAYLCASCGPCGRLLQPHGDCEPERVFDSFKRQLQVVVAEGVDAICVETMTDLVEATLAVKAARAVSPETPVMATMTFDDTPRGFYTVMGVNIEEAASELTRAGADVIGSNCGNGIENMIRISGEFRRHTSVPLIIQSNAGLPEINGDTLVYRETPEFMAEKCGQLLKAGVSIIGGCCGTTPEHIAAIRGVVDGHSQ